MSLEDIQSSPSIHRIGIDHVGVTNLRYPIVVLDRQQERQETVGQISMSVDLPHHFKGTHMSRFIEVLNMYRGEITLRNLPEMLDELKRKLEAEKARVEVRFPYFLEKAAPKSGAKALMDYSCAFVGEANGKKCDLILGLEVPVTSLCPCSKAISEKGAHNQRGYIGIQVRTTQDKNGKRHFIWIEELIEIAERAASAPVYPFLKREDEKYVTAQAYDNPVFVEDMVRNVAAQLQDDLRVAWFHVRAENQESIHNHNAFAEIEWARPAKLTSKKEAQQAKAVRK